MPGSDNPRRGRRCGGSLSFPPAAGRCGCMISKRSQRRYNHRLVALVHETGDPSIATRLGVPRSAAAGWIRRTPRPLSAAPGGEKVVETRAGVRDLVIALDPGSQLLLRIVGYVPGPLPRGALATREEPDGKRNDRWAPIRRGRSDAPPDSHQVREELESPCHSASPPHVPRRAASVRARPSRQPGFPPRRARV